MIFGRFDVRLTSKRQIVLPEKLRKSLGNNLVITKGLGIYLLIVEAANIESLLIDGDETIVLNKNRRDLQRYFLGNAAEIQLDRFGRFVIPGHLKEHAHLQEEIVFAGIKDKVEVWDKKAWDSQQSFLDLTASAIADTLHTKQRSAE